MKTTQTLLLAAVLSVGLLATTGASATMTSALSGQVVNDSDLNLTWLADANYAKTSGYHMNGMMSWDQAQSWVISLNTTNYLGYHDWRLPTTLQPDASCQYQDGGSAGINCVGSEMGHLFYYELGGVAGQSIISTHTSNYNLFQNLQSNNYWSATDFILNTSNAWYFDFNYGYQSVNFKGATYNDIYFSGANMYTFAVRDGQVAAVPVPAAVWLLGSGLLGLSMARRKAV